MSESTELSTEFATDGFAPVELRPLPDDAPEYARILNDNLNRLAGQMNSTNKAIVSTMNLVDSIKDQVAPVIDMLSNSPMLGMMFGRKKQ